MSRETVILVHGTFAGAENDGGTAWWQTEGRFRRALADALGNHVDLEFRTFRWGNGPNAESARRAAGETLFRELIDVHEPAGERYHVVAHSHGGSVVWYALAQAASRKAKLPNLASVTTIATPFLKHAIRSGIGWMLMPLLIAIGCLFVLRSAIGTSIRHVQELAIDGRVGLVALLWGTALALAVLALFSGIACARALFALRGTSRRHALQRAATRLYGDRWLGVWSDEDEAINGLASTPRFDGRLTPRLAGANASWLRRIIGGVYDHTIARIGDSFVWERLSRSIQGLDLATLEVVDVAASPAAEIAAWPSIPPELDDVLQQRAMTEAAHTLGRLRSRLGWARDRRARLPNLLTGFSEDMSWAALIHNSYFDDAGVVALVAHHISGKAVPLPTEGLNSWYAAGSQPLPRPTGQATRTLVPGTLIVAMALSALAGLTFMGLRVGIEPGIESYSATTVAAEIVRDAPFWRTVHLENVAATKRWPHALLESGEHDRAIRALAEMQPLDRYFLVQDMVPRYFEKRDFATARSLIARVRWTSPWATCRLTAMLGNEERIAGLKEESATTIRRAAGCAVNNTRRLIFDRYSLEDDERDEGLERVARELKAENDLRALRLAAAGEDPRVEAEVLTAVARTAVEHNWMAEATAAADRLLAIAPKKDPDKRGWSLRVEIASSALEVVQRLEGNGQTSAASALRANVQRRFSEIWASDPERKIQTPDGLVDLLRETNLRHDAEEAADRIYNDTDRGWAWLRLARDAAFRNDREDLARINGIIRSRIASIDDVSGGGLLAESLARYELLAGNRAPAEAYQRSKGSIGIVRGLQMDKAWFLILRGELQSGCAEVRELGRTADANAGQDPDERDSRNLRAFELACRVLPELSEVERARFEVATRPDGVSPPTLDPQDTRREPNAVLASLLAAIGRTDAAYEALGDAYSQEPIVKGVLYARAHGWADAVHAGRAAILKTRPRMVVDANVVGDVMGEEFLELGIPLIRALDRSEQLTAAMVAANRLHNHRRPSAPAAWRTAIELFDTRELGIERGHSQEVLRDIVKGLKAASMTNEIETFSQSLEAPLAARYSRCAARKKEKADEIFSVFEEIAFLADSGVLRPHTPAADNARQCVSIVIEKELGRVYDGRKICEGLTAAFATSGGETPWPFLEHAYAVTQTAYDDKDRWEGLRCTSVAFAKAGRYRRARTIADEIYSSEGRVSAYADILRAARGVKADIDLWSTD